MYEELNQIRLPSSTGCFSRGPDHAAPLQSPLQPPALYPTTAVRRAGPQGLLEDRLPWCDHPAGRVGRVTGDLPVAPRAALHHLAKSQRALAAAIALPPAVRRHGAAGAGE